MGCSSGHFVLKLVRVEDGGGRKEVKRVSAVQSADRGIDGGMWAVSWQRSVGDQRKTN